MSDDKAEKIRKIRKIKNTLGLDDAMIDKIVNITDADRDNVYGEVESKIKNDMNNGLLNLDMLTELMMDMMDMMEDLEIPNKDEIYKKLKQKDGENNTN